jgi:hypothetical protein
MNSCDTVWQDDGQPGPDAPQSCMILQNCSLQSHPAQAPQSLAQVRQLSDPPQAPSPHASHTPQSMVQEAQVSVPPQVPSPHPGQAPQSLGHEKQLSSDPMHAPSPHPGHGPQSGAHERQSSGGAHEPSPHDEQTPQSPGHEPQLSEASQAPLPHVAHSPQSIGQPSQVSSSALHVPSPHGSAASPSASVTDSGDRAPHDATTKVATPATNAAAIAVRPARRERQRTDDIVGVTLTRATCVSWRVRTAPRYQVAAQARGSAALDRARGCSTIGRTTPKQRSIS